MAIKTTDLGGFGAILVAGFLAGKDSEKGDFTNTDLVVILLFLAVGFYLAVYLS